MSVNSTLVRDTTASNGRYLSGTSGPALGGTGDYHAQGVIKDSGAYNRTLLESDVEGLGTTP